MHTLALKVDRGEKEVTPSLRNSSVVEQRIVGVGLKEKTRKKSDLQVNHSEVQTVSLTK